jgi:hypothetical protein
LGGRLEEGNEEDKEAWKKVVHIGERIQKVQVGGKLLVESMSVTFLEFEPLKPFTQEKRILKSSNYMERHKKQY